MKKSKIILFELKRMKKLLPQLILGAIVLSILVSTIAICNNQFFTSKNASPTIRVALVNQDTSSYLESFLPYIEEMESISSFITLIPYNDLNTARKKLNNGMISCIIYVPEESINGILTGNNQPILLYFNKQNTLENKLLEELTMASGKTLSIAQACIYATHDLYVEEGLSTNLQETYDSINIVNLRYALMRNALFEEKTIYASGAITLAIHYFSASLLVFLLLYGIPLSGTFEKDSPAFISCLKQNGIKLYHLVFSKIIATFTLYLIIFLITIIPLYLMFIKYLHVDFRQFFLFLSLCIISLFLISIYISLCYTITKSKASGILFTFLASISMLFLSGCIIPTAFLPDAFITIGQKLPTASILSVLEIPLTGEFSFSILISLLLYIVTLLLILFIILKKQEKYI